MRISVSRIGLTIAVGFTMGAILGHVVGLSIRSDNLPFLAALGAAIGLCIGLAVGLAVDRRHAA
jgi:uncharacterized protein YebE (UPF0316 family)